MRPTPRGWWRSPSVHLTAAPLFALVWFAIRTAHLRATEFGAVPAAVVALVGPAPVATGLGYVFALVLGIPILSALRHEWGSSWWWSIALLWLFLVAVLGMVGMLPAPVVVVEAAACFVLLIYSSPGVWSATRPSASGQNRGT